MKDMTLLWMRVDGMAERLQTSYVRQAWQRWVEATWRRRYNNRTVHLALQSRRKYGRVMTFMHWRMLTRHAAFVRAYRAVRLRVLINNWRRRRVCRAFSKWYRCCHMRAPTSHSPWLMVASATVRSFRKRLLMRAVNRWRVATIAHRVNDARGFSPPPPSPSPLPLPLPSSTRRSAPGILETGFGVFERRTASVTGVSCSRCVGGSVLFVMVVCMLAFLILKVFNRHNPGTYLHARGGGCLSNL